MSMARLIVQKYLMKIVKQSVSMHIFQYPTLKSNDQINSIQIGYAMIGVMDFYRYVFPLICWILSVGCWLFMMIFWRVLSIRSGGSR